MYISSNASKSRLQYRSSSPPLKRSRYQRERSRSIEKNGHSRRGATPTDIRRKNHVRTIKHYSFIQPKITNFR